MTMVTVKDAAARFNVSAQTMRNWCKEGRIPGAQQVGRYWQVPETALPEAGTQPPAPEPVLDTSELRPQGDGALVALLGAGEVDEAFRKLEASKEGTYDTGGDLPAGLTQVHPVTGGRFSQGMDPSVISRGFANPEPPFPAEFEEPEPTLDEVHERLTAMRDTLNKLGNLAGDLHAEVVSALTLVERLSWDSEVGDEKVPAPSWPEGDAAHDQAALDELLAGKTVPLETLDEVLDTEPVAEIDSDPRELWEIPAADPRDVWEDAHHE